MKSIRHLLFESHLHLLMEDYRLDKIKQIINKRLPEQDRLSDEDIQTIIDADPTAHGNGAGKYGEWLVKQYIQADSGYRSRFFEDLYKYTEALKRYHELKTRNKVSEKDINKIADLYTLQDLVKDESQESILHGFPDTRELESKGEVEVLLRDPQIHIYWTKTHRANTVLGSNTKWCTVPESSSYFDTYNNQGPIFILYIKKVNKIDRYQYHFESDQFMNVKDVDNRTYLNNEKVKSVFLAFAKTYTNGTIALYYKDEKLLQMLEIQKRIIKNNPYTIQYIKNPSEAVQIEAVKESGLAIKFIKNPSEAVQLQAVKRNVFAIQHIENPSEAVQLQAVKENGLAIKFIENPSEAVQIEAVNQNGFAIRYIENPNEEAQLQAMKQDGSAIEYIKNPSEAVQLQAVNRNGFVIRFIKNPSEAAQIEAVEYSGLAIRYIENPSEMIQLQAMKRNGYAIEYIKNPSEEVQLQAVKQDVNAIQYIENPSEAVREYMRTHS